MLVLVAAAAVAVGGCYRCCCYPLLAIVDLTTCWPDHDCSLRWNAPFLNDKNTCSVVVAVAVVAVGWLCGIHIH